MEKNNGKEYGQYCSCPNCQGYMGMGQHGHYLLRWLLGLLILLLAFWLGVKIGEFKGMFESEYGYGMMGYRGGFSYPPEGYFYPMNGMMNTWDQAAPPTANPLTAPLGGSTKTTK